MADTVSNRAYCTCGKNQPPGTAPRSFSIGEFRVGMNLFDIVVFLQDVN
jgi:hypothetical protein